MAAARTAINVMVAAGKDNASGERFIIATFIRNNVPEIVDAIADLCRRVLASRSGRKGRDGKQCKRNGV